MKKIKLNPKIFTAGGVAVLLLVLVYITKGIYPFGDATVATQDMVHGYLPVYYHLWDFLHGEKSLFFDWYTGTGVNMAGIVSANGLLSPTNLILYLFPRDSLMNSLSFLLMFRIFLIGCSAQYFFIKRFPDIGFFWQTLFASMYALSGFCIYYYFHLIWLDLVFLFPFIVLSAEKLFRQQKILPLIITLSLALIISFYMAAMIIICLFFTGGLYIFVYNDKKTRRYSITRLGIAVLVPAMISMFITLPAYLQMSSSSRYSTGISSFLVQNMGFEFSRDKAILFLGLQVAVFFIAALCSQINKFRKDVIFCGGCILYMFLPFFIEGADLLWHFGSYKSFPMRFAFMSIFFIILPGAVYLKNNGDSFKTATGKGKIPVYILSGVMFAGFCLYTYFMTQNLGNALIGDSYEETAFFLGLGSLAVGVATVTVFMRLPSKMVRNYAIGAICFVQVFFIAASSIDNHSSIRGYRIEHTPDYVERTLEVEDIMDSENMDYGVLDRVKNSDMSLNINYGFLLRRSTVNNWTHQIPDRLQTAAEGLGYSTTYTLLLDTGGTAFGEALLGTKSEITKDEEGWKIQDCEYTLPSGFVTDGDLSGLVPDATCAGTNMVFQYQNSIYTRLGGEGELFEIVMETSSTDGDKLIYNFDFDKESELYIACGRLWNNSVEIYVNGEIVTIDTYMNEDCTVFPLEYYKGVMSLGSYKGKVTVCVKKLNDNVSASRISFGIMNNEGLSELCDKIKSENDIDYTSGKRSLTYSIKDGNGGTLFVPVNYDEGMTCLVNGEETEISMVLGSFMAVSVPAGDCTVEFKFTPSGLREGIILSVMGILLAVAVILLNRKRILEKLPPVLCGIVEIGFIIAFALLSVGVYIAPLVINIVYQ